jgi:glycosyltransferase involved in cell wall biosynthesis
LEAVHAVCANGDALVQTQKLLGGRAVELPIGVDTRVFCPGTTSIRQSLGWTDDNFIIGYVGRLLRLKGVDVLAAAFHEISRRLPHARLLMVGGGEKLKLIQTILRDEIGRGLVHLESDVPHDSLPSWYRAMDLFVMPSRYENFSNAILEALACGVSFLASDVGGNRMLAKAVGGELFSEGSVPSLAMLLEQSVENCPKLKRHKEARVEYVRRNYTWAATAECLEVVIKSNLSVA